MRIALWICVAASVGAPAELARAGACGAVIEVSPAASPMPRDGVVLLELSGDPRAAEAALPQAHFATADGDVPARVVRQVENGRLQVLLAPVRALPASQGTHVELGLADVDRVLASQPIDVGDAAAPAIRWTAAPSVVRAVEVASNKGDGTHAMLVRVPVTAPGWVLATIGEAGHRVEALYRITDGSVQIGTVGCASAYFVDHAGARQVELTAIGASGRATPAPSPVVLRFR